ncbi:MAG: deoxyribonuclease V [Anaerolineae bacterium]
MEIQKLHEWHLSEGEAIALQLQLAPHLIHHRPLDLESVRYVAGVDTSVKDQVSQAAVVVMSFPDLQVVEAVTAQIPTPFPYIAGLLSFREGPALEIAFKKLQHTPDVFIFDGMGRIHPRRIGIACHMGLWLNKPTLGCGKTLFIGKYVEPPPERGAYRPLMDRGEQLGVILRTKMKTKPVFISTGHLIDLPSAIAITMACTTRYRLPEPIRAAHATAGQFHPSNPLPTRGDETAP